MRPIESQPALFRALDKRWWHECNCETLFQKTCCCMHALHRFYWNVWNMEFTHGISLRKSFGACYWIHRRKLDRLQCPRKTRTDKAAITTPLHRDAFMHVITQRQLMASTQKELRMKKFSARAFFFLSVHCSIMSSLHRPISLFLYNERNIVPQ